MKYLSIMLLAATPVWAQDFGSGARNYAVHCAGCHGADGRGDGVAKLLLDTEVPDLTGLTARNGGVFPLERVVFQIDGRARHADAMPDFGPLLEGETVAMKTRAGQPVLTSVGIAELVAWLDSVQEPPG